MRVWGRLQGHFVEADGFSVYECGGLAAFPLPFVRMNDGFGVVAEDGVTGEGLWDLWWRLATRGRGRRVD